MRTLNFNSIDGLVLDPSKSLTMLTDLDALVSKIEQRLRFFLGEWFLDTNVGVPYIQQLFEKPVDAGLIVNVLSNEISKQVEVEQVLNSSIELNKDTREFSYTATINTIYGSSTISTSAEVS